MFIRLACAGLALSRIGVPVCACSIDPCEVVRRVACDAYLLVFSSVYKNDNWYNKEPQKTNLNRIHKIDRLDKKYKKGLLQLENKAIQMCW